LKAFTNWAERRVQGQGSAAHWSKALLATVWTMIGVPLMLLLVAAALGGGAGGPGSVPILFGLAIVLAIAGYFGTLFLIRRWSR
jgi:hypothetical protein